MSNIFVNRSIPQLICKYATDIKPVKLTYKVISEEPPPLLMLHGLYGSKSNLNSAAKGIHRGMIPKRRVIIMDSRNHGKSPHNERHTYEHLAADVKALMEDLNLKKASLLGHSMGGKCMLYFALKNPEMVDKLIISDICHVSRQGEGYDWILDILKSMKNAPMPSSDKPLTVGMKSVAQAMSKEVTNQWLRMFLLTNLQKRADGSFYWRLNIDALIKDVEYIANFPDVSNITYQKEVLYLLGSESSYVKESDIPEIKKLCPKAEIKSIENAGHLIHIDNPKAFVAACLEFLNRKST